MKKKIYKSRRKRRTTKIRRCRNKGGSKIRKNRTIRKGGTRTPNWLILGLANDTKTTTTPLYKACQSADVLMVKNILGLQKQQASTPNLALGHGTGGYPQHGAVEAAMDIFSSGMSIAEKQTGLNNIVLILKELNTHNKNLATNKNIYEQTALNVFKPLYRRMKGNDNFDSLADLISRELVERDDDDDDDDDGM
jgi:hypothetical protein